MFVRGCVRCCIYDCGQNQTSKSNPGQNQNGCVLMAKVMGNLRAETAIVMTRMVTRARICFTNCSKMGASYGRRSSQLGASVRVRS